MPDLIPDRECRECGAGLHLLQQVCEECGTAHEWSCRAVCSCGRETEYLDGPCACGVSHSPWRVAEFAAHEAGAVTVAKNAVERPTEAGYRRHVGTIRGQWADYRRVSTDGEFHIRVYLDHYELHVDAVSALGAPTQHTLRYGPRAAVQSGVTLAHGVGGAVERVGGLLSSAVSVSADIVSGSREH
ncbi:MAG: hypothetical protein ACI9K3_000109 [Halovenus sp.]|jgi:hypothetical protein